MYKRQVKGYILACFFAVLVCDIERLLIADSTDNFQIFFRKGKIAVVFLGKFVDRILCLLYTSMGAEKGQKNDGRNRKDARRCHDPVSYTHLDVYKRQRSGRSSVTRPSGVKKAPFAKMILRSCRNSSQNRASLMFLSLIHI